jgi:hypothetical protein
MVKNILIYGLDGKTFFCTIIYPESWAESAITKFFLPFLESREL